MLGGKKILVGITAGIAAYKINFLIRLLVKEGAEVRVIVTPAAKEFVSVLTLSTLAKNPVASEFLKDTETGEWQNHVELGAWADLFVIAPLTANTLSKMITGGSDNLLMATYLSAKTQVMVAPAMDLDMYKHPSTLRNLEQLEKDGVLVIPAAHGELASGLVGEGRLPEPETILDNIKQYFEDKSPLSGKHVVITAGPTYEPIDPVRYVGNRSSGKMGYALAKAALNRGAKVTLVSGPTQLELKDSNLHLVKVETAQQMFNATLEAFTDCDLAIFSAAVADYTPGKVAGEKIKKQESAEIKLVKTKDILHACGHAKRNDQIVVGFALETNNEEEYAQEKLKRKNADFIVLNSLNDKGAGFQTDTNKVTLFSKDNNKVEFELMSKEKLASKLFDVFTVKLV